MLRVDPQQRGRLIEIIRNLHDRIAEAKGWHGEVQELQTSLDAARNKLASIERMRNTSPASTADLGMPNIPPHRS